MEKIDLRLLDQKRYRELKEAYSVSPQRAWMSFQDFAQTKLKESPPLTKYLCLWTRD